jgi:hypothetical protein
MIIKQKNRNVIQSRYDMPESEFKLEKDQIPFFMSIMRNQIYANKPAAVVREYTTNAIDEHIMHKVSKPVEITVPTSSNPTFEVRDYAPGLSDEEIRNVYVSYGKSTKRETNDLTGCMGIGCKAAFAYADSFIIVSTVEEDGKRWERTYTALLDESDVGMVKLMHECATQKPTGITIQVPVEHSDINAFANEISKILWSARQPVKCVGSTADPRDEPKVINDEVGYKFYENDTIGQSACAHMGNIIYPLNPSTIEQGNSVNAGVSELLNKRGLEVSFELGELSIAASRESLSYDKTTIQAILDKFTKVANAMSTLFIKEMQSMTCIIEKAKYAHSARSAIGNGLFTYATTQLNDDSFKWGDWRFYFKHLDDVTTEEIKVRDINIRKYYKEDCSHFGITGSWSFVLYDTQSNIAKVSVPRRLKQLLLDNTNSSDYIDSQHVIYLITYDSTKTSRDTVLKEQRLDTVTSVPVIDIETIEPLPSKERDTSVASTVHVTLFKHNERSWGPTSAWQETKVSIGNADCLYLPMNGYYGLKTGCTEANINNDEINTMLDFLRDDKNTDYVTDSFTNICQAQALKEPGTRPPVYGARKKNWNLLTESNTSHNLYDLYAEAVWNKAVSKSDLIYKINTIKGQLTEQKYQLHESYGEYSLMESNNYYSRHGYSWVTKVASSLQQNIHESYSVYDGRRRNLGQLIYKHLSETKSKRIAEKWYTFYDVSSIADEAHPGQSTANDLTERLKYIGKLDELPKPKIKINKDLVTKSVFWVNECIPMLNILIDSQSFRDMYNLGNNWPNSIEQIRMNYSSEKGDDETEVWKKYALPAYQHKLSKTLKIIQTLIK